MDTMSEVGGTRVSVCIPTNDDAIKAMKDLSKLSNFMCVGSEVCLYIYIYTCKWRYFYAYGKCSMFIFYVHMNVN